MASTIFGFYFLQVNMLAYSILAFSLAGSLMAFLIFNFQPAKIFMGDTGSLLIGLVNAILVVKFINVANQTDIAVPILASPAIAVAILVMPLMDTLRVFAIRAFNRRSPFSPDRNHIHHLLLDRGLSHRNITLLLVSINLLFILAAYAGRNLGCTWIILAILILFFSGIAALYYTRPRARLFVAKTIDAPDGELKSSKIVPLTTDTILEHKN
jgi:UDP-N-acetylmuramyl pentapeptide phosphotransferase/UDP-N-acetylglucosamine-1-phosphate transferase